MQIKSSNFFNTILIFFVGCCLIVGCAKKEIIVVPDNNNGNNNNPTPPSFITYTIKKGLNFSDFNFFKPVNITEQKFVVIFDSSAIYTTINPINQLDINKLYGFSDNDSAHHVFSARFGWYWANNKLTLHGYVYNNGVVIKQALSSIPLKTEITCGIKVNPTTYTFTVNGVATNMPRASKTLTGKGYQLYPYFGGDEMAPQDIRIKIKEL